jgi:hypothetical protein
MNILNITTIQATNPEGSTFLAPKPHIRNYPETLLSMSHPHNHFFSTDFNVTLPPWPWTSKQSLTMIFKTKLEEQYVPHMWHSTLEIFMVKVTDHPSFAECS